MGLLFGDSSQVGSIPPVGRLQTLIAATRTQKDIGRILHQIKQLLSKHPQLERLVPDEIKTPVRLVVTAPSGNILRSD
jgi:hypothetical protein